MKRWISLLILLWPLTLQANDSAFKKIKKKQANLGPGCNVSLKTPVTAKIAIRFSKYDGKGRGGLTVENPFNLKTDGYIQPFNFIFTCYSVSDGEMSLDPVHFNTARNEWVLDIDKRIAATGIQLSKEGTMDLRREFARAIKLYPLNNINARGYAYTEDDLDVDEEGRQRTLRYCLIRDAKALCGKGWMGYLKDGKKGDLTPYALKILRSIEFIEDADPIPTVPIYFEDYPVLGDLIDKNIYKPIIPIPIAKKSKIKIKKKLKQLETHLDACSFRLTNYYFYEEIIVTNYDKGDASIANYSPTEFNEDETRVGIYPLGIYFKCLDKDDPEVNNGWAKFNKDIQEWEINSNDSVRSHEDYKQVVKSVDQLRGRNSQGYVALIEGDIGHRGSYARKLEFCFIANAKALCGDAFPIYGDETIPDVLRVLRSIEFFDDR